MRELYVSLFSIMWDMMRRRLSANQEVGSQQTLDLLAPRSWTFHPLELRETTAV